MNYTYSLFVSILLISANNVIAMNSTKNDTTRSIQSTPLSISAQICDASLTKCRSLYYFNVLGFKECIVKYGATIQANDLDLAYRTTYKALHSPVHDGGDPQRAMEYALLTRDYTAAMIAINKIRPGVFNQDAIQQNMQTIQQYYAQCPENDPYLPQKNKWIHIAEHRWGICTCNNLAECNWPAINKS